MKKLLSLFSASLMALAVTANPVPDEGMWLPIFVKDLNYQQMQAMGLELTADQIYDINNSSLKDAIVNFGDFCTAEVVSDKGLLFTNHHCGYDAIQKHSSIDHDYLTDGFWSKSFEEELPCEGLYAKFFVRMENVTDRVLSSVNDEMSESERETAIDAISMTIEIEGSEDGKYHTEVHGLFAGNEYYLFVYKVYTDVRLVAAPPSSIGKFGGDTDNWMWPRHTGDFSIFRVYANADNEPADYSPENVPFKPSYVLPISLGGYEKDDFSMIWGYPGSTDRYLPSYGVEQTLECVNPAIDGIFDVVLSNMKKGMDRDQAVNIMYASTYASYANLFKNKKGETRGLKRLNVYDEKLSIENDLRKWINANPQRVKKYGDMFKLYEEGYQETTDAGVNEIQWAVNGAILGSGIIEAGFRLGMNYNAIFNDKELTKEEVAGSFEQLIAYIPSLYVEYDQWTEETIFREVVKYINENFAFSSLSEINGKYKGDADAFVDDMLEKSVFANYETLMEFAEKPKAKKIAKDPIAIFAEELYTTYMTAVMSTEEANEKIAKANRLYQAAIREMNSDKAYYPNANMTMRLTYGSVLDYYPADAVHYDYTTKIEGIIEKEDPTNPEFIVPEKLIELYNKKDYGRYADENGDLIVNFLTNNDITGGNSGSPVINGKGQLIGIAFDGNWEAMSGDIAFEPELQRCINVDIRYVLFVIDKFAGCTRLIDELNIVKEEPQMIETTTTPVDGDATNVVR